MSRDNPVLGAYYNGKEITPVDYLLLSCINYAIYRPRQKFTRTTTTKHRVKKGGKIFFLFYVFYVLLFKASIEVTLAPHNIIDLLLRFSVLFLRFYAIHVLPVQKGNYFLN